MIKPIESRFQRKGESDQAMKQLCKEEPTMRFKQSRAVKGLLLVSRKVITIRVILNVRAGVKRRRL